MDANLNRVEEILGVQGATVGQLMDALRPFIRTEREESIIHAAKRLTELTNKFIEHPSSSLDHQIDLYTQRIVTLGRML